MIYEVKFISQTFLRRWTVGIKKEMKERGKTTHETLLLKCLPCSYRLGPFLEASLLSS